MRKLLLALALALVVARADAAISYFGATHIPATENTDDLAVGPDMTLTPPASMAYGDFVFVYLVYRSNGGTYSITTTGGQNWRCMTLFSDATGAVRNFACWTTYNGTWAADPVFHLNTSSASFTGMMTVWRGVDKSFPFDTGMVTAYDDAALSACTAPTYSTLVANTLAIFMCGSRDDNTWTVDNGFAAAWPTIYWRQLSATDTSIGLATKAIAAAGAVGATILTQSVGGPDGGIRVSFSARPDTAARRGFMDS